MVATLQKKRKASKEQSRHDDSPIDLEVNTGHFLRHVRKGKTKLKWLFGYEKYVKVASEPPLPTGGAVDGAGQIDSSGLIPMDTSETTASSPEYRTGSNDDMIFTKLLHQPTPSPKSFDDNGNDGVEHVAASVLHASESIHHIPRTPSPSLETDIFHPESARFGDNPITNEEEMSDNTKTPSNRKASQKKLSPIFDGLAETYIPSKSVLTRIRSIASRPANLQRAKSLPVKQSTWNPLGAFGTSTVLHKLPRTTRPNVTSLRPNVKDIAAIYEVLEPQTAPASIHRTMTAFQAKVAQLPPIDTTTTLSSYQASLSPLGHHAVSSPPTSFMLDSNSEPGRALKKVPSVNGPRASGRKDSLMPQLSPIVEKLELSPPAEYAAQLRSTRQVTIDTVCLAEKTAATKIYFETFYESPRGNGLDARSLRRRKLELGLQLSTMSDAEQQELRKLFVKAESEHLREQRVLKIKKMSPVTTKDMAQSISSAGFDLLRVLGQGSFGIVSLVREKTLENQFLVKPTTSAQGSVFAMKVIDKSPMLRNCQEAHLRAERDFLVSCAEGSRWIVPLITSFQDYNHLYLVMDFEIGGDFMTFLEAQHSGVIPEAWAQWYIAEMILCVEEAHKLKWIHRDVKPDNFLISASGHLKIADFGLAFDGHWAHSQYYYSDHRYCLLDKFGIVIKGDKEDQARTNKALSSTIKAPPGITVTRSRREYQERTKFSRKLARTMVGTSQYMAPEVICGEYYDGRCDWWSIGIIMFECLFGYTPFCRMDREHTKAAIRNFDEEFEWPTKHQPVSYWSRHLIWNLIKPQRERLSSERYWRNDVKLDTRSALVWADEHDKGASDYAGRCVYSNDAEDIKSHPFFDGVPWEYLHLTQPPHIPRVHREDETKYFESESKILQSTNWAGVGSSSNGKGQPSPPVHEYHSERRVAELIACEDRRNVKDQRAKDKLLRDPLVKDVVMDVRKKAAFLGYTYRRPKTWNLGDELGLPGEIDAANEFVGGGQVSVSDWEQPIGFPDEMELDGAYEYGWFSNEMKVDGAYEYGLF